MKKMACAIFTLLILVSSLLSFGVAHATYVNNSINYNTDWTAAGSPYVLTTNLAVNSGVTLTIEPGVTVNLGGFQLQVNGVLNAQGIAGNPIIFTENSNSNQKIDFASTSSPWNDQSSSGCIISNAIIYSVPMTIDSASPKISNNYFASTPYSPIIVNGGGPLITGNTFNLQSNAEILVNYGYPFISYNTIKGGGQNYGIYTESVATASITNNNITSCFSGIYSVGASNIQQNNIMNNVNDGVRSNNSASTIQNNVITNNLCGIGGEGNIFSNTITANTYGLWGPTEVSTITNNNIFSNTQNIHLTENATILGNLANVNTVNNWWGTTDVGAIDQTIWDFKNATNLGTVTFVPFLTQSNPIAPMVPSFLPIPTVPPTATPASSTPAPAASPFATVSPTPAPTIPNYISELTPSPTISEVYTSSPQPIIGNFNATDVENVGVIVLSFSLAVAIIVVLNRKFSQPDNRKVQNRPRRRKKKGTR